MIAVVTDVCIICLEICYMLFLLGKETVKSRKAKALMVKLGFYAVVYLTVSYTCEVIVKAAWRFFDPQVVSVNMVDEDFQIFLFIVSKALRFFLLYMFWAVVYCRTEHITWHENFPAILSGLSFMIMLTVINTNIVHIPGAGNKATLLVGDAGILTAFILNIIFTEKYIEVKRISEEEKQKSMQLQLQYQYYVRKKEDMDYIRQIYHDLKNYVSSLEEPKSYSRIDHRIQAVGDYHDTGNGFLDVIISDKRKKAADKQIHLECDIDFSRGSFVQPLDISTIFGNLLDNAMEASDRIVHDKKYIFCKAEQKRDFLIILVQNPYDRTKEAYTKEKSHMHGFGLKNVQDAVKKYNGIYSVEKESDIFKVSIMLPIWRERLENLSGLEKMRN